MTESPEPTTPNTEPITAEPTCGPVLFHDFDGPASEAAPAETIEPRLIVTERRRGLGSPLIIPALILSLALVVAAWKPFQFRKPEAIAANEPAPIADTASTAEPAPPLVLKIRALEGPAAQGKPAAEDVPDQAAVVVVENAAPRLAAAAPLPDARAIRPDAAGADPLDLAKLRREAEAQREQRRREADATQKAIEQIQREAEAKRIEKAEAEALVAQQPALEKQREADAIKAIEEDRAGFRDELRQLLSTLGEGAGPRIWELAESRYAEPPPGSEQAIAKELRRHGLKLSRSGRIALFRSHGLPEPIILSELVRDQLKAIAARNGPRDRNEAIIRAARQLLAAPAPDSFVKPASLRLERDGAR